MHPIFLIYVRWIDALNDAVGRFVMYMLLLTLACLLLYGIVAPMFGLYPIWILESSEFVMVAYFMLGGGYAILHDGHVRMDVFYSRWRGRTRAIVDTITDSFLIIYLGVLLYGGVTSAAYAVKYNQHSVSAWSPPMAPVKIVVVVGIVLTLLQAFSVLIKDIDALIAGSSDE